MLLLPKPRNLMLGYLLGAIMTSVSLGLVIVFSLEDLRRGRSCQGHAGPGGHVALEPIFLIIARVLSAERHAILKELRERTRKRRQGQGEEREGPSALAASP